MPFHTIGVFRSRDCCSSSVWKHQNLVDSPPALRVSIADAHRLTRRGGEEMQRHSRLLTWVGVLAMDATAMAADVPVTGLKLIVVDKVATTGTSKAVFVTKDPAVTKGPGTDPLAIDALL